ncbi:Peptidase A1 [Macleaya cordata]|uniref:Peptidase A1 n=1 Tax=Macleaya cordata TaxID=56857 RepID=A0A200QNX8_MACCD|nr:Peptidase A1 [Macleaya cordata]
MALIISLPIGTPPQTQQMVLDTGSQLSWIQCNRKLPPKPPLSSFDPSLSSSFSVLPCNHPLCKPRIPDFTLPTSCDQNRLCHYSYFYADGTLAEGNLVREKITLSNSQSTPPLILGCTRDTRATEGILGMNRGRLSFASQTKISKFSYCVPVRQIPAKNTQAGTFYLGENPNSGGFQYVDLLTFSQSQRMPNFDPAAYTVGMEGIRIGGKMLNIPRSVFRPDPSGAGQTMIDSGTEYTFLVDEAYVKVRDEVLRLAGPTKYKKGFVYEGSLDLCFDGDVVEIGRLIGDLVLEFDKGVEIVVKKERVLTDVGGGVGCLSIGRSDLLGIASNIIGNFHQQNLWVEFDVVNRRVGFGPADCRTLV